MAAAKKRCFFITPIGPEGSQIRNRSDWIFSCVLRPVVSSRYELIRADQISEPGSITVQIVRLLADADLTIADLTGLNANVVYELGVRHTLNQPSIQLMDKDQQLPFDLIGERTIFFKHDDIRSVKQAQSELKKSIQQIERDGFTCTSPISRAIDITGLLSESSETKHQLATILQEVINVKDLTDSVESDQSSMELTISDIESSLLEIKDTLSSMAPQRVRAGGIYIDDQYIVRLLEDIELHLKKALKRP